MLSDITHSISKHISKNIKFNLIWQFKNTPHTIITHSREKKQTAFICWKPTPSVQDNRKNNFKHSIGLYNKLTFPALEGKPGKSWKYSSQKAVN